MLSLEDARDYRGGGLRGTVDSRQNLRPARHRHVQPVESDGISLYENEGNSALTYEELLAHISRQNQPLHHADGGGQQYFAISAIATGRRLPLLSSFISDCLDKGRDITDGGARNNSLPACRALGIANLSDSLHALNGLVFEQQRLSFDELLSVLKGNLPPGRRKGSRQADQPLRKIRYDY